jgi:hypothetical protein
MVIEFVLLNKGGLFPVSGELHDVVSKPSHGEEAPGSTKMPIRYSNKIIVYWDMKQNRATFESSLCHFPHTFLAKSTSWQRTCFRGWLWFEPGP